MCYSTMTCCVYVEIHSFIHESLVNFDLTACSGVPNKVDSVDMQNKPKLLVYTSLMWMSSMSSASVGFTSVVFNVLGVCVSICMLFLSLSLEA